MKVALIPPVPDLERFATTDIHLLLSHLFAHPGYLEYYSKRRDFGDYIILDNSAHENGAGNLPDELLDQAVAVRAQEVVCPDVLFDDRGTVSAGVRMFRYMTSDAGWEKFCAAGLPRLMLVPQGTTRGEWVKCLTSLMHEWEERMSHLVGMPPVIGVSKDYEDLVSGGITSLIAQYLAPLRQAMGIDVHCLGWPSKLWSLAKVQQETPWVRSTDSAKPFVYARAGIRLEPGGTVPRYPRRAHDYFTTPTDDALVDLARINVEVFKAAATDELILA